MGTATPLYKGRKAFFTPLLVRDFLDHRPSRHGRGRDRRRRSPGRLGLRRLGRLAVLADRPEDDGDREHDRRDDRAQNAPHRLRRHGNPSLFQMRPVIPWMSALPEGLAGRTGSMGYFCGGLCLTKAVTMSFCAASTALFAVARWAPASISGYCAVR